MSLPTLTLSFTQSGRIRTSAPRPSQGRVMADLTGYISYRQAKFDLDSRLQTSDEEMALWVSGAAGFKLDAYVIGFRGKLIPFLENGGRPFGGDDYIMTLEGLYFSPTDIEQFNPCKRFIAWRGLVERWKKYNDGGKAKTISLIDGRRGGGLFEYHPVTGGVLSTAGEGFERGLFDLAVVEAIEEELNRFLKPTKPQHDDGTPVKTNTNTKRTTKLNAWLREKWDEWDKPNAKDFAAKLKPFQGAHGSPVKKYYGWLPAPNIILEWQPGWGSTSNSWTLRTFANKVDSFKRDDKNTVVK